MSENTVTKEEINNILDNANFEITHKIKTTIIMCTLPNGFVIVESSSCVDPKNYDAEIGEEICMERIENKVWELEGYKLQSYLAERA